MGALPTSFSLAKKGGMRTAEWKEGNDGRTVEGFQFEVPNLWDIKKVSDPQRHQLQSGDLYIHRFNPGLICFLY